MSGIMYQACVSSTIATDDVVLTVNGEVEQRREKGISPIIEIREAFAVLFAACRELRELPRVM
jgi:hypothetical protein